MSPCAPCSNFLSSEDDFCKWLEIVKACSFRYYATFNIAVTGVSTICHCWENGNITIVSVFTGLKHDIRGSLHLLSGFCARVFFPLFAVCFCLGDNEGYHLPHAFYQGTVLFSRLIKTTDGLRWVIMSATFLLSSSRKAFRHGIWIEL